MVGLGCKWTVKRNEIAGMELKWIEAVGLIDEKDE